MSRPKKRLIAESNQPSVMSMFANRASKRGVLEDESSEVEGKTSTPAISNNGDDIVSEDNDNQDASSVSEAEASSLPPPKRSKGAAKTSIKMHNLRNDYDPLNGVAADARWEKGQPTPYLHMARTFEAMEKVTGRYAKVHLLSNMFRSILAKTPDDFLPSVYLCSDKIGPAFEGLELGVGDSILIKCIKEAYGREGSRVKEEMTASGDLGKVATASRKSQKQISFFKPKPLTVKHIHTVFRKVALEKGKDANKRRESHIMGLLTSAREVEPTYLVRALQGKMRIGSAGETLLMAVALALTLTPPQTGVMDLWTESKMGDEAVEELIQKNIAMLKQVYSELPSFDEVIPAALALKSSSLESLHKKCHLKAGIPVKPMLAKPTKGVTEILDRFTDEGEFTCEYKYDGERAQIHRLEDGTTRIYSRNMEDNTGKYPDLIKIVQAAIPPEGTTSFILDTESVAFLPWTEAERAERLKSSGLSPEEFDNQAGLPGKLQEFQILSTRSRKDVKEDEIKVPVCVFAFDCLYMNGESLLQKSFQDRRSILRKHLVRCPGKFEFASSRDFNKMEDTNEISMQQFLEEAVQNQCEGLMVKTLTGQNATYEPSKRSLKWLKLKKDYLAGVGDTLDLVPIAGYLGKGKRTGWYGAFLMAAYDETTGNYASVCKLGTGFKEEDLKMLSSFYSSSNNDTNEGNMTEKRVSSNGKKDYYDVNDELQSKSSDGDIVWFEPVAVWEVKAADLSISPVHRCGAGLVDPSKGIALRFPRFLRIREDKKPEDATTSEQVVDMYKSQASVNSKGAGSDDGWD